MQTPWGDFSVFQLGLVRSAQPVLEQMQTASIYHLQLAIEPDLIHITGKEEVRYTNNEEKALTDVHFRLFPNILGGEMHVPEVMVDEQAITPSYTMNDSLLTVPLPSPLQPAGTVTLTMDFTVQVSDTVELNYGVLASAEGVLALAHAYPMIPVYNEEGWNAEIPPQSGDVTFADMSFFLVQVTAPDDLIVASVGRELSRSESGQIQVITYAAGPVRDFYLAASRDYTTVTGQVGETKINFYGLPSQRSGAQNAVETAVRAIEDYGARFTPYPYTELDLVETPTLALGIEYPGMIAIADRILSPGDPYLEGTIAHEVGHQWFYNLVGSDQLDHPWLDESLAQFATLEYFTDEYGNQGANGFRESLNGRWERVGRALTPIGLPVAEYSAEEYGAIVYGRGPLFFDALREQIGDEAFDAFLHDYTITYSWGIATPEGLKELAEKHCACDLTPLFQEWVYP
jgi:aminopeptidase N